MSVGVTGGFHHSRSATYFFRPRQAVVVGEALITHPYLLEDPPGADILRHHDPHDAVQTDRPETVRQHGDRRLSGIPLVPGGSR